MARLSNFISAEPMQIFLVSNFSEHTFFLYSPALILHMGVNCRSSDRQAYFACLLGFMEQQDATCGAACK